MLWTSKILKRYLKINKKLIFNYLSIEQSSSDGSVSNDKSLSTAPLDFVVVFKCGTAVPTGMEKEEELLVVFAAVELFVVLLNNVFQYSSALAARSAGPGIATSGTLSRRRRLRSILRKLSNITRNMQRWTEGYLEFGTLIFLDVLKQKPNKSILF